MQTIVLISSNQLIGAAAEWVAVICITVFICLLMALYLLKKLQERKLAEKARLEEKVNEARSQELEWYREKRFLMESQAREKQARLETLITSVAPENSHRLTYPATRLFYLAESIREERQHLGTDISKLSLIDRRLRKLGKECIKQTGKGAKTEQWLSKMSLCRQMIQSNREDLRKSQNLLRNVLSEIVNLEEKARNNDISTAEMPTVIKRLENTKNKLSELPEGLRTVAKTTGEQAQALFQESTRHIPDKDLHSVWKEQTSLDLFSSKHRPGGRDDLLGAAEGALGALNSSMANLNGFSAFRDLKPEFEPESDSVSDEEKDPQIYDLGPESKELGDDLTNQGLIGMERDEPFEEPKTEDIADVEIPEAEPETEIEEQKIDVLEEESEILDKEEIPEDVEIIEAKDETTIPSPTKEEEDSGYKFDAPKRPKLFEFPGKAEKSESDTVEGYRFRTGGNDQETERGDEIPQFNPDDDQSGSKTDTPESNPEDNIKPESTTWVTPADFGLDASAIDKKKFKFNPLGSSLENDKEGAPSLVIFRSDNPEIWNTTTNEGEDNLAIAINEISGDVKWIGVKRVDTGEEVFSEITLSELKSSGEGKSSGFNGSNEYFYGARHLGFFSEDCATEVETRFTYGGWGFGHHSTSEGDTDEQICGWNGQRIPNGTIFEFTIYEAKPERVKDDQIIL